MLGGRRWVNSREGEQQRVKSARPVLLLPNAGGRIRISLLAARYITFMSQSMDQNTHKMLIKIDAVVDFVCPWCFVGKKNLDKAIDLSKDQFDFEVRWHPFILSPEAPKEGRKKSDFFREKFGPQYESIVSRTREVIRGLGYEYDMSGLWGSTLDSHRLVNLAGSQGFDKQNLLVDELFVNYHTKGKYIGDKEFLLESAGKAGVEGAEELLLDPSKRLKEVQEELKTYARNVSGVPYFVINEKREFSGGQPPEVFVRAFEAVAK